MTTRFQRLIGLTIFLLVFSPAALVFAESPLSVMLLTQDAGFLRFYQVEEDGTRTEIQSLAGFAIWRYGETGADDEWLIIGPDHIQISPQADAITWTAFQRHDLTRAAFFIFSLDDQILQQFEIPYPAYPQWSPDGSKILLSFPQNLPDAAQFPLSSNYVYVRDTQTLIPVGSISSLNRWLNEDQFLSLGDGADVFIGEADGSEAQNLTGIIYQNFPDELRGGGTGCGVATWSETQQRAYAIAECPDYLESTSGLEYTPHLYSFGLNGDVQVHANITDLYTDISVRPMIFGAYAGPSSIYVVLRTYEDPTWGMRQFGDESYRLMIARLADESRLEVTYEESVADSIPTFVESVQISPDGTYMAVGMDTRTTSYRGRLAVIDLQSGDKVIDLNVNGVACNLHWSDDHNLVFSERKGNTCNPAFPIPPTQIATVDVLTGTVMALDIPFNMPTWTLPIPPVVSHRI